MMLINFFKRLFFNTSYEKLSGDRDSRRGSVPVVPSVVVEDTVAMETPTSTPSRFTNFLIRKGFKTNLKRTKSAHKLDRKRNGISTPEPERSVISSRLKNSQSHESLLTTQNPLHSIDLTGPDMEIRPIHSSILSQEHCFQVSTMHGNKIIACRTAEEREKWIMSFKKSPEQENSRRSESSLKLWVQEAKNVPSKKRYFCEVCLDKTRCARTSIKTKGDMLFWGEQFEFNNLPTIEYLIVNLYREADRKKKKERNTSVLVGYTKIPVSDISARQYVERWFTTSSGTVGKGGKENKTDLPLIRLKVRHQTVQILPKHMYNEMSKYLSENYVSLIDTLEPLVSIKDKEEIATTLIKIMQKLAKSTDFLSQVVMTEVLKIDNSHLTFRGNSLATKAMEAHMKLVGEKYLNDTLGDFLRRIINTEEDCEVDPTRVNTLDFLPQQRKNLRMYCDMAWAKIKTSSAFFPSELRSVFMCFRHRCEDVNKGDLSDNLISASIFLRFLCPAILSPSLFHLTQEYPTEKAARNLTLIAKTIQTLANFSKFGSKEEYMTFMNDFVEEEWTEMKSFINRISSPDENDNFTEFDGYIDLGKEMSVLQTLLTPTLENAPQEAVDNLGALPKILTQVENDLKDPNIHQRSREPNRKSQHYDNLVNIQAHIDHTTSPTELLRDMFRQCGESSGEILSSEANESMSDSPNGSLDNVCDSDSVVTEESASSKSLSTINTEVSNVSVSARSVVSKTHVNKSWNQIVSAAEIVNGDYIDLISFMDEEGNNSIDSERNVNGSQMSISQESTIASSGYQSFGYSQSSSPIDNDKHDNVVSDSHNSKSQSNNYTHSTPLSFSNPMYRINHRGISSHKTSSPVLQMSSSSSLSSEETNTVKNISPVKSVKSEQLHRKDPLRKLAPQFSNSSSIDSVSDKDKILHSVSNNNMCTLETDMDSFTVPKHSLSNNNVSSLTMEINRKPRQSQSSNSISARKEIFLNGNTHQPYSASSRKYSLELRGSSPVMSHSAKSTATSSSSSTTTYYNTIGSTSRRGHELSQSADFSNMSSMTTSQRFGKSDSIRRTATDTSISQRSSSSYSDNSPVSSSSSPRSGASPDDGSLFRRLSAQNAVHMGIRSVQRRIHDQEKTKQEYELEVNILKQQLQEAQQRLQLAEERLQDHDTDTDKIDSEWQTRLEESEERMRKQQAEKDGQMKTIIQRLMHVEDELREEQEEMQRNVAQKQKVIEAQERRIHSLDVANNKLMLALNQLKEHYSATARNGLVPSMKLASDVTSFKTSSC
ncbi:disabled homolog 2-interacting protein-like isoform X4 [Mya arenaria]|uniref:disabled homolog 2-interacting protein-like isoform X4 n=1 Tax=Mya arenaria TaxID=6604 RepID=UPI0022E395C2|nr:disabled homolog 2-interacting protein-like isoform X4 [Mya arenaria]